MRSLRFGVFLLLLAAAPLPLLRGAEEVSRLDQLNEQIKDTEALLEQSTRNNEKAQFQKQLDRLRRERENEEQRARLVEKEKDLARARTATPQSALDEAVNRVDHSESHLREEIERVEGELRKMEVQRDTLVGQLIQLKGTDEKSLAQQSEVRERVFATREGVVALNLELEALKSELRLAEEAARVATALRESPAPTEVKLELVLGVHRQIVGLQEGAVRDGARLTALQEKRALTAADLELNRQKLAQIDDQISLLEKQTGLFNSNAPIVRQLNVARSEKKFLDLRLSYVERQLTHIDRTFLAVSRRADLHTKESAWLEVVYLDLRARFTERLVLPATIVGAMLLIYLALSRVVFPRMKHRENLVLMRRFARYVVSLAAVAVIGGFLFDDLKMVVLPLGIVSAGIVIALQDVAASIAGWFVIMTGGKFRIGDRVEIEDDRGDVLDIDLLRTTILEVRKGLDAEHPTGRVITLPNSFVLKGKVFNASHGHPHVWSRQVFTFTNESPWRLAESLVQRVLHEETMVDFEEARRAATHMEKRYGVSDADYKPKVYIRLADWGTEFACLHVCHFRKIDEVRSRIHRRMAEELAKEPRLAVAYPTQRQVTGFESFSPSQPDAPAVTATTSVPTGSVASVTMSEGNSISRGNGSGSN